MRDLLPADRPLLVLAPMQAVTDLPFMRVMARYGGPDVYVTEYFRVYENSRLDPRIPSWESLTCSMPDMSVTTTRPAPFSFNSSTMALSPAGLVVAG